MLAEDVCFISLACKLHRMYSVYFVCGAPDIIASISVDIR